MDTRMDLKDKVPLVTGAGSGIGKACALKIASEGSRVIVHAHKEEEITATVDAIQHASGTAFGITADFSRARSYCGFGSATPSPKRWLTIRPSDRPVRTCPVRRVPKAFLFRIWTTSRRLRWRDSDPATRTRRLGNCLHDALILQALLAGRVRRDIALYAGRHVVDLACKLILRAALQAKNCDSWLA